MTLKCVVKIVINRLLFIIINLHKNEMKFILIQLMLFKHNTDWSRWKMTMRPPLSPVANRSPSGLNSTHEMMSAAWEKKKISNYTKEKTNKYNIPSETSSSSVPFTWEKANLISPVEFDWRTFDVVMFVVDDETLLYSRVDEQTIIDCGGCICPFAGLLLSFSSIVIVIFKWKIFITIWYDLFWQCFLQSDFVVCC